MKTDPIYLRPTDVEYLQADPTKAREKLGWQPETTFEGLVELMLEHDLAAEGFTLEEARERARTL